MTIEERRAELVAFVENEYGGQEVLKLADAYALAVLTTAASNGCSYCADLYTYADGTPYWQWVEDQDHDCDLGNIRRRIEALS